MKKIFVIAAFFLLGLGVAAHGETVSVEIGSQKGQGWLFKDPRNPVCAVVTAAHLVNGNPPLAKIVRAGGQEGTGVHIQVLSLPRRSDREVQMNLESIDNSDRFDIAIMNVVGTIETSGCSSSTLGGSLTLALGRFHSGVITPLIDGAFIRSPLDIIADDHKAILTLKVANGDNLTEGTSGSPLLGEDPNALGAAPLPLGMIIQGDGGGIIRAVRFDLIRDKVLNALSVGSPPQPFHSDQKAEVSSWSGQTVSPACQAPNAVEVGGNCGWKARPLAGSRAIILTLHLKAGSTSSGIVLKVSNPSLGQSPIKATIESGNQDSTTENWAWQNICQLQNGMPSACTFSGVQSQYLRLTIAAPELDPTEVRIIEIRQ